ATTKIADAAGKLSATNWEDKFQANFDRICAAFWSRIASHAEQTQMHTIPATELKTAVPTTKHSSEPETHLAKSPHHPAHPPARVNNTVVLATRPSSGLGWTFLSFANHTPRGTTGTRCNVGPTILIMGSI
ncbi:Hypothetical predicted protein, partial [Pelobates cultripes]